VTNHRPEAVSRRLETVYLGWDRPLIPAAVEALCQRFADRNRWDLSSLACVLPTSRGVRRLAECLQAEAERRELPLRLPRCITTGELASVIRHPGHRMARDFEQTLAWTEVLRGAEPETLRCLVTEVPGFESVAQWLDLAGTVRRLHVELASHRLDFASVLARCETDADRRRWQTLESLRQRYLQRLAASGLVDPQEEQLRIIAEGAAVTAETIVLIGTTDLSPALAATLRSLDAHLLSLVAAPASEASRFDEIGVVLPQAWSEIDLPLRDDHLVGAGDIADQSTAVAEAVAEFAGDVSADQLTIGVTDESQVSPIEVQFRGCGVQTSRHLGWTVAQTPVGRLLSLTTTLLQRPTWNAFAAFVRHSEVHDRLCRELNDDGGWIDQLDGLLANHFPVWLDETLPLRAREDYPLVARAAALVRRWLEPFRGRESAMADWSERIRDWLQTFGSEPAADNGEDTPWGESGRARHGRETVSRVLDQFRLLPRDLDLVLDGPAAIEALASRLGELRVRDRARRDDVEILGWLDLPLDDAPALVVAGLNHPFVPEAVGASPFLPAQLKSQLRGSENDRRYARDAHALHVIISSRRHARFVVGRRAADGSPTPPSRLLAAAPAEDVARRIRGLLGERRPSVAVRHGWDDGPSTTTLPVPPISDPACPRALSVTAFRDYLVCPYRFYLRHVLKLRPLDDAESELAANQFGDLIHGALERFGLSDRRDETDPQRIRSLLVEHLHAYAEDHYGSGAAAAVQLQVVQAEKRLASVARAQAARRAAGWVIHAAEASVDEAEVDRSSGRSKVPAGVVVDGEFMGLRGRFDRIDHHPQTGRWAILDYKTHGHPPEKKHLKPTDKGTHWVDLQLPLYRTMIPFLGIEAEPRDVELGYFNVSEKDSETRINLATFSDDQFREAGQLIQDCIRSIRAGRFEPTNDRVPFDDYGMILQTGVAQRMIDAQTNPAEMEIT